MTLREYYEKFQEYATGEPTGSFSMHMAAEVAAAHEIGLTFEQLKQFLRRRTQITSVATALVGPTLTVEAIERILVARQSGAVHPKEVLVHAFAEGEVHEKFRAEVYASGERDA